MRVRVRPVRPEDHERVGVLTAAAYVPFLDGAEDPYLATLRDTAARAALSEVWVAEDEGVLLGSVTDTIPGSSYRELAADDEGEFRMLAVAPEAQGRGVGPLLVQHVVGRSRAAGRRAVVLSSLPTQTVAHRIYERLGFLRTPARDWEPAPGVVLLAFRLDL